MNKQEYLNELRKELSNLSEKEIDKCIEYYSEIIDDYIEDGVSETDAINKLEPPKTAARNFKYNLPLTTLIKTKVKIPKDTLNITLLVIGFPLWISLIIAFFAVIISVYAALWSAILSLYAVTFSLIISGIIVFLTSPFEIILYSNTYAMLALIGTGLILTGTGAFIMNVVKYPVKLLIKISGLFLKYIKSLFITRRQSYEK